MPAPLQPDPEVPPPAPKRVRLEPEGPPPATPLSVSAQLIASAGMLFLSTVAGYMVWRVPEATPLVAIVVAGGTVAVLLSGRSTGLPRKESVAEKRPAPPAPLPLQLPPAPGAILRRPAQPGDPIMSLQFPCPCGRLLQVPVDLGGKRVRCPSCSRIVWAPAAPESVPEARLVDGPPAPRIEPVAVNLGQPEPPMAKPPVAETPQPSLQESNCCAVRHDCGAAGGFILSLGSLVFGVVACPLGIVTWPVGGALGALVSCCASRRIRAGRGNPASAGLARAGMAIGVGQAILGLVLVASCFAFGMKHGHCGGGRCELAPRTTITVPAQKSAPVKVDDKKQEAEDVERK